MINIGIFCGSANGSDPVYREAASQTGQFLAEKGMGIIYGGGKVGLMGAVADAALAHGGHVTGVIPQSLVEREIAHTGLTHLHVVANMHERKMKMAALSDAFIAMPGGGGPERWKRFSSNGPGRSWGYMQSRVPFMMSTVFTAR